MSKTERSRHMALVRSRNTNFELVFLRLVSAELYPLGYRYRKHCRRVFGNPDVVFHRYKLAIFIDSDFWHGRNYKLLSERMNLFWREKIERNMERDRQVDRKLRRNGWSVLRFGERQIKRRPLTAIARIKRKLKERSFRGDA
jgi:DNA mismatch endonuclease (patch repair protein)